MEFVSRKPVNSRKGKCYHRGPVARKTKFETEKYWKSRKNRALHQLSREENEVDHEDFLVPTKRKSRWDVANAIREEESVRAWNAWSEAEEKDAVRRWNEWNASVEIPYGAGWEEDHAIRIRTTDTPIGTENDEVEFNIIFIRDIDPVIITNIVETNITPMKWRRRR
jgi:hypothetical protein